MHKLLFVAMMASMFFLTELVPAQNLPAMTSNTTKGKVFADAKGMTLYTYDRDASGKSNCSGQCAIAWPPFEATADAKSFGDWTIVIRGDGGKQWAYKGKSLYLWKDDKKPGDITGDGVNNVWRLATP
jgi:predicted lipoprotein with Yx(FWY)xxD motif